jgi:SOS-response transcriptional repressor LexA
MRAQTKSHVTERVYEFVSEYQREFGYPPTLREIADDVGHKSTAGIRHHLLVLQDQGRIAIAKNRARGFTITDRPHLKYEGLIAAAKCVVSRWEKGDLAEAVNLLDGELEALGVEV